MATQGHTYIRDVFLGFPPCVLHQCEIRDMTRKWLHLAGGGRLVYNFRNKIARKISGFTGPLDIFSSNCSFLFHFSKSSVQGCDTRRGRADSVNARREQRPASMYSSLVVRESKHGHTTNAGFQTPAFYILISSFIYLPFTSAILVSKLVFVLKPQWAKTSLETQPALNDS